MFACATAVYFCSESWTNYSSYSTENVWLVKLPGGYTGQIRATTGRALFGTLLIGGALATLLAYRTWRRPPNAHA